jgi:hypothetical protein
MVDKPNCPICNSDAVVPILRNVEFTARVGAFSHALAGFVAFSCASGHVFLIMSDGADVFEDRAQFHSTLLM